MDLNKKMIRTMIPKSLYLLYDPYRACRQYQRLPKNFECVWSVLTALLRVHSHDYLNARNKKLS